MRKKMLTCLLGWTMSIALLVQTTGIQCLAAPNGGAGGSPGGGSSSSNITWTGATEITEEGTYSSPTYSSTTDQENAVLIKHSSGTVTLVSPTVTKNGSGGSSDDYNFYGINAAVMCKDGGTTTITGGTIQTEAAGANAVFSYGGHPSTNNTSTDGTTVNISDTTITTTGQGAGGIMTTGGGIMKATNLTITTSGGSSAPIRTDRGGGDVDVTGGTYTSNGQGSPAIYSVTDVDVSGATLISNKSEGVVIEGAGSVELTDSCSLTGNNTALNGNATFYNTVFIYQSMSGDASDGTSLFTMNGGSITSKNGHVFHITNTDGKVNLTGVTITNEDSDNVLLSVCDDGWSTSGQTALVNATDQTLSGDMLVGSNSSLTLNLSGASTWTGKTTGSITNGKGSSVSTSIGTAKVYIGAGSTWVLSGDCTVSALDGYNSTYGSINYNGYTLTVGSTSYSSGSIGSITEASGSAEENNETTYMVTFDANGGTCDIATATTGTNGRLTELPTPTYSGYTFNGWYTAATDGTQITTSTVFTADTTIYAQWTEDVTPTAITLSDEVLLLTRGSSITLHVTFTPENTTNQNITWASSNTSVATVDDGKVVCVGKGSAVITATSVADSSIAASCTITVTTFSSGLDSAVAVSETTQDGDDIYQISLVKGQKITLNPGTWTYSAATDKKIVSVTKAGVITAKAAGKATLTYSNGADTGTYQVTVYTPKPDKNKLILYTGGNAGTLTLGRSAGEMAQSWLSSNEAVATVSTEYDSETGVYYAQVTPVGKGNAKITAYVGGKAYPVTVTVKTYTAGTAASEEAGVYNVNMNAFQNYKPSIKSNIFNLSGATWKFTDEGSGEAADTSSIVTIASNGKITASAVGYTTATGTDKNKKEITINITVKAVPLTHDIYMNVGKKTTLRHMYLPANGVSWKSTVRSGSILTLANTDKAKVSIQANQTGEETIICTYNGVEYETTVHVEDPGFDYTKTNAPAAIKSTNAYNAALTLPVGSSYSITEYMKAYDRATYWRSSKPAVAFVDEWGQIEARSAGVTVISGRINGKIVKLKLTVTNVK